MPPKAKSLIWDHFNKIDSDTAAVVTSPQVVFENLSYFKCLPRRHPKRVKTLCADNWQLRKVKIEKTISFLNIQLYERHCYI